MRETSRLLQLSPIESVEGAKWHKEVGKVLKSEELKRPISQYVNEAKKIHINSIFENQKLLNTVCSIYSMMARQRNKHAIGYALLLGVMATGVDILPFCALKRGGKVCLSS